MKINFFNKKKKLITESTINFYRKKQTSTVTPLLISNQQFNAENEVTRPCVAILVIFNTLPCSGVTGGVQLEDDTLFFDPSPIVRSNGGFTDSYGIYSSCWSC